MKSSEQDRLTRHLDVDVYTLTTLNWVGAPLFVATTYRKLSNNYSDLQVCPKSEIPVPFFTGSAWTYAICKLSNSNRTAKNNDLPSKPMKNQ